MKIKIAPWKLNELSKTIDIKKKLIIYKILPIINIYKHKFFIYTFLLNVTNDF